MPRQFRAIKEGVGKKTDAPSMQAKSRRLVGMRRRRRSGWSFCSPTENHQKSINPQKPKLIEAYQTTSPDCPAEIAAAISRAARRALYQKPKSASRTPCMSSLTLRHKLPSHVFASHHLRLAFAPLRACSALPCSCLEPSALGVRPALFSSRLQRPD